MVPVITHKQIQLIQSLKVAKYRQRYQKFVIEGDKICRERLDRRDIEIDSIFALPTWISDKSASLQNMPVYQVNQGQLKKISNFKTPNQVVMVCKSKQGRAHPASFKKTLCFYLDDIRDPGNFGTIIRILDWFGFRDVYHSPQCVDRYNPKVLQASMGSFFNVNLWEFSFQDLQAETDLKLIGTGMGGTDLNDFTFPLQGLIIIGNESRGINQNLQSMVSDTLNIVKNPQATAESLNAAVACAIVAYASAKQLSKT